MIPTYYDSPEKLAKLREAAALLLGTPFFANSEAPGRDGGIDCVRMLNFLHRFCGAIVQIEIPRYNMDHGFHSDRSLLVEAFDTWPELKNRFRLVWRRNGEADADPLRQLRGELLPGDTLCFLQGAVPHHGGVLLEHGQLLHTLKGPGVHAMGLDVVVRGWRLLGFLMAVYRPIPRD